MNNNGKLGAVVMSNWQHTLMAEAIEHGGISLNRMLELRQITSGSLIKRQYFRWDDHAEMFLLTPDALRIMESFVEMDVTRKATYRPLSSNIKDRSVHRLAEARRQELKEQYAEQERQAREAEKAQKPKRKKSKSSSGDGQTKSRSVAS